MLSHLNRFHGHGSLRYVYNHGARSRSANMGLHYSENPNRVHSRFAIVVSKKVHKSAVSRNRVRRRIYEIIRLNLDNMKSPCDYIVTIFNPEVLTLEQHELEKQLLNLLAKEKLIS